MNSRVFIATAKQFSTANALPPRVAAKMVTWLISQEQEAGGPYAVRTPIDNALKVNYHAVRLFSSRQSSLSGAIAFLLEHQMAVPVNAQKIKQHCTSNTPHIDKLHSIAKLYLVHNTPIQLDAVDDIMNSLRKTDANGEISLLSTLFCRDIASNKPLIDSKILDALGVANILLWTAYSLYDTALDSLHPDLKTIPLAHIILRHAHKMYTDTGLPVSDISRLLDITDKAQSEEVSSCRFTFTQNVPIKIPSSAVVERLLGERSLAHCIGPLMLHRHFFPNATKEHQALRTIMQAYCATRQLLDDLHDWKQDFVEGRWTLVTVHLVRGFMLTGTDSIHFTQDKEATLRLMEEVFFEYGLSNLITTQLQHLEAATRNLTRLLAVRGSHKGSQQFIQCIIQPLQRHLEHGVETAEQGKVFIESLFNSG